MDPFETLLRDAVSSVSYKDWTFRVTKDGIGVWFIQVRFHSPEGEQAGRKWL